MLFVNPFALKMSLHTDWHIEQIADWFLPCFGQLGLSLSSAGICFKESFHQFTHSRSEEEEEHATGNYERMSALIGYGT